MDAVALDPLAELPESGARPGREVRRVRGGGRRGVLDVDPQRRHAAFYRLDEGSYRPVLPDVEGRVHSSALLGFALPVSWLWDRPKLLDTLRELGLLA